MTPPHSMMIRLFACLSLVALALGAPNSSSTDVATRRERNLDHLNVETLAYYLGVHPTTMKPADAAGYVGFDVAVMFYAQWDQNSHSLAPYWDNIGTKLRAGSKQSKLVMGLFNCELSSQHSKLCTAAGIKSYPTILFIGAGRFHDTDPFTRIIGKDRSAGPAGAAKLPRTVKFQGNWQYTDSLKDWIRTMQGLSAWNRLTTQGFLKNLRAGLLGFLLPQQRSKSSVSLPVGVPAVGGSASVVQTSMLEKKLEVAQQEGKMMEKAATHASLLLDNVLFPPENKDPFVNLKACSGWNKTVTDPEVLVLRTCVTELSLDYCSRLSTRITNDYLDQALKKGAKEMASMADIEKGLTNNLTAVEPYCGIFDECYAKDFVPETCRAASCPFQQVGCSYLTACFDDLVRAEYAVALGLIKEGDTFPPRKKSKEQKAATSTGKKGKWGFF